MLFNIEINDQQVSAKRGETIMEVLGRVGVTVPTLCHMPGFPPSGGCRMCVVEVEGMEGLVPACSHPVEEWMKIKTHSPRVIKARKTIVELLLASHPDDCLYCDRNGNCELQDLAAELNIRERKYHTKLSTIQIDKACTSIERDPSKCILCQHCIKVCDEIIGISAIEIMGRGSESRIGTTYNKGFNLAACVKCGQCIMVCPTAAITEKSSVQEVVNALNNPSLYPVVEFSPTLPAALAEEFNLKASKDIVNLIRAAFKAIGFRQVFDVSMAADLNIMEVAAEFTERYTSSKQLPLLISHCPSWVKYIEDQRPSLINHLSTARSPQQMMGRLIKNYITRSAGQKPEDVFVVSVMPCTSKKHESELDRQNDRKGKFVDAVLTTRELVKIIKMLGIDFTTLEPEPTDTALCMRSSASMLYGMSGGALEGILRTVGQNLNGQDINPLKINELRGLKHRKEARCKVGKQFINVVAVSGLANAKLLMDEIEAGKCDFHIVEVMACPFGCINGGGQKIGTGERSLKSRMKSLYDVDEEEMLKVAHKNPIIADIYDKYLAKPNSERNRELLHVQRTNEKNL